MKGEDKIKEIFSEKLRDLEVDVNPALWNNIAKEIGGSAVPSGLSALAKAVVVILSSAAIITTIVLFNKQSVSNLPVVPNKVEEKKELVENEVNTEDPIKETNQTIDEFKGSKETPSMSNDLINYEQEMVTQTESELADSEAEVINEFPTSVTSQAIISEEKTEEVVDTEEKEEVTQITEEETTFSDPIENTNTEVETSHSIERLPNIFSPNNDGQHDVFFIESSGLVDFTLVVLDKNNNRVFPTSDPNFKWLGNDLNGNRVPAGNYVYFLTARDLKGAPVNQYNSLTISR